MPATVKMMVLDSLERLGGVEYLMKIGKEHRPAYCTLLGKIIPTQVVGDMSYRYVARIPPPETDTDEWLRKYAPPVPQPSSKQRK